MILHWTSHRDGITYRCEGALQIEHEIPTPQEGELWFGALSFDEKKVPNDPWQNFPSSFFFRPEKVYIEKNCRSLGKMAFLKNERIIPSEELWEQNMIKLLQGIRDGHVAKVVQARRASYQIDTNPQDLAEHIFSTQKKGVGFFLQLNAEASFMSATPELLYYRHGNTLITEAIAGTIDAECDSDLLLKSEKDCSEHALVTSYITERLAHVAKNIQVGPLHVVHAQKLKHLRQEIKAILPPGVDDKTLINLLHPTSAVLGLPIEKAKEWIDENEPFMRGYYAAPLCLITKDKAEIAVGLRSALTVDDTIHLYAGSGIVQGSTIEKEKEELKAKWRLYHDQPSIH